MPDTAPRLTPSCRSGNRRPAPPRVRARHAASLVVLRRRASGEPEVLMGMRGATHRFMPNRLVFPGGAVDRADLTAPAATPLSPHTERVAARRRPTPAWRMGWASPRRANWPRKPV